MIRLIHYLQITNTVVELKSNIVNVLFITYFINCFLGQIQPCDNFEIYERRYNKLGNLF